MRSLRFVRVAGALWPVLTAAMASPALAAPFCLETQAVPPQCNYFDAHQCQQDAAKQGGVCSVNNQQVTLTPGIGQYCVVTSQGVSQCMYADRGTCADQATRQGGACTEAPNVAPARTPDPYAAVGGF